MPEKISIVKESGETLSSNIVSVFTIPDTEKKYIITTENSVDPHGLTVLHVSEILDGSLKKIATDDEWSSIKTIMRAIISGNVGSYKYLPGIETIKADGQYSRDISVSASASKQMIDNYQAADVSADAAVSVEVGKVDSIFPEAPASAASDNEVMPGISEVEQEAPSGSEVAAEPVTTPATTAPEVIQPEPVVPLASAPVAVAPTPVASVTPAPVTTPVVAEPITTPAVVQTPVVTPAVPEVAPTPVQPAPVVAPAPVTTVVQPEPAAPVTLNNDVQVLDMQEVSAAPASNNVVPAATVVPAPVVPTPVTPVTVEPEPVAPVQVAAPAQSVPSSQIVQGEVESQAAPEVNFNPNVQGSFKPDASLDEVVKGAEEMFMEGVRNLVQTIEEKVYRELYVREADLKKREAVVAQKEQMLNTQFATMMSNITSNFNGVGAVTSTTNTNDTQA